VDSSAQRDLLFEELVERHSDVVYHVARAWCRDPNDAEDLMQSAFLKAYRAFARFEPGTNFKAWVLRIMRNTHVDRMRASTAAPRASSLDSDAAALAIEAPAPAPAAIDLDNRQIFYEVFGDEIGRLLRQLPADLRLAVLLCDVEGLTYAEIADVLGCPVGTVRSRIHRGRARLGHLLEEYAAQVGYLKERQP
jgi:RNA polymerase sigma-70 factor (ECF subfamily)